MNDKAKICIKLLCLCSALKYKCQFVLIMERWIMNLDVTMDGRE